MKKCRNEIIACCAILNSVILQMLATFIVEVTCVLVNYSYIYIYNYCLQNFVLMEIGDTMYQCILDYHFTDHILLTMTCVIYIPQVSYIHYTHHLMCVLYNTGSVDVNVEAVSALSNAHQFNNCLVDNSTLVCFINDEASDDRAVKCCISNHYHHNGRRRLVVVEVTATNSKCIYVCTQMFRYSNNYVLSYIDY